MRSYCCLIRTATTELLGAPAARHRQLGCVCHLSVGQDAISEPHTLLFTGTTWRHTEEGRSSRVQSRKADWQWSEAQTLGVIILSLFGCLRTDTGTMTVGGGELRVPAARACCRGGMVLQYSDGTLGFGLGPEGLIIRSRAWATRRNMSQTSVNFRATFRLID